MVKFVADLLFGNVEGGANPFTITVLSILGVMIILGFVGLLWNIKWCREKSICVTIRSVNNVTEQHFLSHFAIFVLFALSFDLSRVAMFSSFMFITLFIGIVYVNNKLFYINPFLNILGYNFYEVKFVREGESEERSAKIFYRGNLKVTDELCYVKVRNIHFSFVERN